MITEFNQIFAEFFATNDPITVVVDENRWEATGPETVRSMMLCQMLRMLGGVNIAVPPGIYHFNYKASWFKGSFILEPVEMVVP